jgi:hypothetical protein
MDFSGGCVVSRLGKEVWPLHPFFLKWVRALAFFNWTDARRLALPDDATKPIALLMAAIARRPLGLSTHGNLLSSRSATSNLSSSRSDALKPGKTLGKAAKATKKKAAAANKAKAAKVAKQRAIDENTENVPPRKPKLNITLEDLERTNIYKHIPRPLSSRRVSFGSAADGRPIHLSTSTAMVLASIAEENEGEEAEGTMAPEAPDYEALKKARRERAVAARAARMAAEATGPRRIPTGEDCPAGLVARNALLGDSLAARMAARRKDKQNARLQAAKVTTLLEGVSGAAGSAHGFTDDLERMRVERERRVKSLFSQLEQLGAGMPVHPRKPLLALTYRPSSNSGANSSSSSTALTVYQNEPLLDGLPAATLVSLLRGEGARRMAPIARQWLAQGGSADKVKSVLERAPEQYRGPLVAVLSRLLSEEETPEDDVRITLLGCEAMLNHGGKQANNEERPLPRPIMMLPSSPLEVWEADADGSFTLRV